MESKIIVKRKERKEKFQIYLNDPHFSRFSLFLCAKLREVLSNFQKKRNGDLIERTINWHKRSPRLKNIKMNENNISDLI